MRNLFDSGVVESFKKTVWKQNEEAKRKDFWTQDAVEGENSLPRKQEDRRKAEEEEETKAWSYESPDTQSMIGSDGVYEGRKPLPKRNMKWQTGVDLRPQEGRNAQLNVSDVSGHVDLRPPIVNRPQVGPEAQLNFLSDEQANEMQRQLEERDGGGHRVPGSGIMNDRQYWRVLNDWRMAGVDSPHYYVERAALRRYEKNRGIDEGSVAAAGDVRKARAWQLLAEIGDGADLDAGQEQEVDQVLGAGTVKFYRGLSQEEKDEVLVDGYDRAFVGASTSLGRAYLAQKLGLDTDEASVMAAELRRQAGVGRARREQVKKDMEDVWGEIVAATGSGKEFSLDPHDHQGRSPEFLAGAARMAESQKKAAALIREFAYGEDGKSPHAQGVRTGVTGFRVMGFSKEGDGSWLVSKLVELNREDPVAYQMALEAVQGLVMKDSDEHGLMNRYFESLPWGGLAKKGMQLMLKPELHKNIFNAASNAAGMAGEAVLGTMRNAVHKKIMDDVKRRKRLKAGVAMTPGDYMLWRKAQENPNVLNGPEDNDPQWVQRVNQVAQDLQRVRMGQFQSRGKTVLGRFIEDAGSVVGGAVPFMASFGVLPVLQTMEQKETEYLAKGAEPAKAALAAMGESVGMWAANIWGLGKGGKLVGKAYDKLMNWAGKKVGYRGLLARALETDRWWGRGPLFVGMEGVVLHSQTVMEPYARYLASNMFTGGDGKSFNEALAEAKEAMTWRNFLVGLPMSVLLGYGRYAQNSPFRASQAAIAEFNRMKLEWADSREAMEGGGFAEADIKAILNAKNDGERLKLFDLGLERSEMMKMVREGKANVENDIALMIVPDSNEANMLMEMGAIPRFEIVDGKVRVYGAESMDFKGQKEEVSARDSVGAEPGKEIKEESEGENEGQERRRRTDYVEFNMDEAGYYLTAKAREWYSNQDFTLKNAVLGNEAVDYFAKRCDVQFEKSGELMTRRYLERMADEALNRVNERRHSKVMWSREEADAQEEDVVLSVLPGSFRNRVEVAMKRNELSRNPQETGKITQREIDARSGDYGVHTPAFNYELECGKKVIRYYEGEATFFDLVEEMAELYVKGEVKAGRELGWFAGNLKETQEAFKAQGVRNWMLADVDLLDGKSGVKKQELAVVEGMSKLMQAVHVGEFRKRKLPESVQRFLEIAMALLRKVADMAGLAGAFRKAVDSGAVKGDFAAFVYDAVGADFIQTRYDAGKREFQKRLNEIKGKPERMFGFYDLHVAYAEQYGLENYLYQLEHPDTGKLQSDSKFLNFVGEKMKREFEAQGREFFEKMKGASLQEMKDVLKAARAWNRRYKNIYELPEDAGKTVSFSITEKLDEMGKDAGKRKVMDFVDMVVSSNVPDKTSLGVMEYRGASAREIADIKAGLGIDVTGMVHEFSADAIIHTLNKHGHDAKKGKDQLDLTKDDVKLVLDVLDEYDRMEFRPKGKNLSSVIYVKQYPHGEIHAVEQVIETTKRRYSKKPRLTFKTAWVKSTPTGSKPGTMGVYTPRRTKNSMANEGGNVNSVAEGEAGNAVITEPGVTFSVIGPNAATWGKYADKAFAGRDDGKLRAEIDASKAGVRRGVLQKDKPVKLGELLDFAELYEAYPDAKDIIVVLEDKTVEDAGGYFSPWRNAIHLLTNRTKGADSLKSGLLHEVQHWIQHKEGFINGISPSSARAGMFSALIKKDYLGDRLRWINTPEFARDELERIARLIRRPAAIKKMGEKYEVQEIMDVGIMARQAIELLAKNYRLRQLSDAADFRTRNRGNFPLPVLPEKFTLKDVQERIQAIEQMEKRYKRGERQQLSRELEKLHSITRYRDYSREALYLINEGELEARAVEVRARMGEKERQEESFQKTKERLKDLIDKDSGMENAYPQGFFDSFEGEATFSVRAAQEQGLFHDGHFEAGNAVITEPGVTFSISALHASPHSFRKFDTAFMGKGEGAQAYGWGLYFAENPEVNRSYMNQFAQDKATWKFREVETGVIEVMQRSLVGSFLPKDALPEAKEDASDIAWSVLGDLVDAARGSMTVLDIVMELHDEIDTNRKYAETYPQEREKLEQLEGFMLSLLDHLDEIEVRTGMPSNYRVELNVDDSVLLNWDRPFSEQSETVKEALAGELAQRVGCTKEVALESLRMEGRWFNGKQIYVGICEGFSRDWKEGMKKASLALRKFGVKGIRYADGFSRGKTGEEQTYNYVIFDGNDIKITAFADESTGGEWADYVDGSATFSVREDLLGDMKRQMEKTRSDAVREYWRHVTERLEREEQAMRALMLKPKGSDEFLRARIAEARSIMKVAVETLPESVRGKLAGQEQKLERWMKLLEGGAFHPGYTLARHDVERLAVDMGIMPEEMPFFIGKRVDELVLKTYRRAAEVIELYVRDGLFAETRKMISEHEAVIDEKTRKFKVSRLGAAPTEFLRSVIKPAVYATHAAAEKKAAELSERLRMLEMQLNEFKDGKVVSGMDALMKERMRLEGEFNWWMNYSAARSSDVNRMLGIHEAVSAFISRNAEVWQAHLHEKLEGWKKAGKALMDELPKDVNQKSMHLAEAEMTDLGTDSETGRIKRGVLSSWLDNTVNKLQQLGDGPGGEFFRKFKVEFLNVTNRTQALRALQVEKMHDVMKKLSGATSERMLNQWLAEWDTKVDLGLTLREKGVKKTKLTIDQAAKLLERREKNPWWGVDMYSQKAIDLLREEYEAWGRGENRARKWFEVEEWYDMDPQPMPKLSRDQALFVLMCMDQANVFDSRIPDRMTPMRRRGWTDEHKMKLEEFIGPEGMALKSILFEEYAQVGDMIRPLYEDRYGVPFSRRRNYSPLRWMVDETRDDSELASILGDDGTIAVGRSDGFLSVRDESHQRYLNTTQGALALFWKHHANAVNWVCTQEMVERYQGILSDPSVAQKLKVNIGALDYRGFQTLINRLEHGGRDAVAELDAAEVVKNRIMNARAVSVLAGQVTSLLRQTTAVFNALHGCDLSTAEWIHGMSRVISGKSVLSVRKLFSSDLFQARKDGFMYSVLLGYKKQLGGRLGLLEQLSEKSMNALGWLDAGCNAVSFAAAFDHYFRQGVEQGMSKPEAMEYARDVIEEGLSTAQPTNWTQMPKMLEKTKGIFSEEWFLMSETLQRGATVFSLWKRGKKKLAMRSWLVQGVAMQVLGYLINNVMRPGGDDDEKKNPLNYLPGIVLGPLNGVPFLGRGADWLIEQAADIFDLKVQTRTGIAGSELEFMIKDLTGLFQDLEQVDNWQSVRMKSRGVATLGSITAMLGAWRNPRGGAITSVSLGMATLANYLKHLSGMAEKWFGE